MSAKRWLILAGVLLALLIVFSATRNDASWDGVDTAVVGRYAASLGREPWTPFINVQGDLQLFVFTLAGLIGGFVLGYCWRDLFAGRAVTEKRTGKGREQTDVQAG